MTLDQYIETLSSMRDRYQAGDFEMYVDLGGHVITGEPESHPMDGDDFFLDLDTQRCVIINQRFDAITPGVSVTENVSVLADRP